MSPSLHTEAPPRVPGCLNGHAPKTYPGVRVCTAPGCGTFLSIYNPGPICGPCHNHSGPPASAHGTAVTIAAPAARRAKEEKVGKESLREAVLLVFARDPSRCFNAGDVVKSSDVSPSCVYKNLKALTASGEIVKDAPGIYHWPTLVPLDVCIEDVKTAPAIPPAPAAPVIPPPEQPANEAPAPEPLPPQARLAPFAGIDYELHVIGALVSQIESLSGHETRVRVAAYVASRFLP